MQVASVFPTSCYGGRNVANDSRKCSKFQKLRSSNENRLRKKVAESKGDRSKSRFIHRRRVRLYDPQTGRFMNQDPLGLRGGLNLYAYASNNPIVMLDPDGNCALSAVLNLSIFGIIVDSLFPIETAPSSFDDVPGIPIIYEPGFNPLPGGGVPPGGYGTYVQNGDGDDTDS